MAWYTLKWYNGKMFIFIYIQEMAFMATLHTKENAEY
jgi:hypothetical protein